MFSTFQANANLQKIQCPNLICSSHHTSQIAIFKMCSTCQANAHVQVSIFNPPANQPDDAAQQLAEIYKFEATEDPTSLQWQSHELAEGDATRRPPTVACERTRLPDWSGHSPQSAGIRHQHGARRQFRLRAILYAFPPLVLHAIFTSISHSLLPLGLLHLSDTHPNRNYCSIHPPQAACFLLQSVKIHRACEHHYNDRKSIEDISDQYLPSSASNATRRHNYPASRTSARVEIPFLVHVLSAPSAVEP